MIRDAAEKYQLQYPSLPVMSDQEVLAKTYFDCHEYDRCAHLLKDAKSPIGLFLKLYSLYIVSIFVVILRQVQELLTFE